ncbi:unnamed protein product [Psylliodes chrysocephalus]|uniref:Uncharacterized protein n=1 Tax=Psylliodes chrysocephalus TaxID=3402493 RepID=A0A9P0D6L2_9CUCU|nr:unnamed protein product [Psylliodes chrysocephala]
MIPSVRIYLKTYQNITFLSTLYFFLLDNKQFFIIIIIIVLDHLLMKLPLAYETLAANLKSSLPSISTIQKYIQKFPLFIESDMPMKELREYLQNYNLPLYVWISKDGTRITKFNTIKKITA